MCLCRHSSRLAVLQVLALLVLPGVTAAPAQAIFGTYTTPNQQGGLITLDLHGNGPNAVAGSLTGNGATYLVQGRMQGEDVMGTLRNNSGGVYFEAHREGGQLRLILVAPGTNGQPDFSKARELVLARQEGQGGNAPPTGAAGSEGSAGAAPGGPAGAVGGATAQDRQLIQLLESSAWCSYSFSGGQTYTGGYGGTERSTRSVFSPNGVVTERSNSERSSSGAPGAVWGNTAGGKSGRWKVQQGMLWLSADGVQWQPVPLQVKPNSNGYPIITAQGKEYMMCR